MAEEVQIARQQCKIFLEVRVFISNLQVKDLHYESKSAKLLLVSRVKALRMQNG